MSENYDDFESYEEESPARNPLHKLLVISFAVFAIAFGSTYAANINIGTGTSEFGQGIQVQSACDQNIYVKTAAAFNNSLSADNSSFGVETVTVSDIAASCIGKTFKLNLFDSTTSVALNSSPITVSFSANPTNGQTYNGSTWSSGTTDLEVLGGRLVAATIDTTGTGLDSRSGKTSFSVAGIVTSANAKVQSVNVSRVSLESTKYVEIYSLGETGPAGGTIFMTPDTLGNPTGKYFEFAPVDVETSVAWATGYSGVPGFNSAPGMAIGAGQSNTATIVSKSTGGGAISAANYSNNGYQDWFLGSANELNALCMYARGIITTKNPTTQSCNTGTLTGTWAAAYTGSSTRGYDAYTWRIRMDGYGLDFNSANGAVRPIRMFS